jgi:hypothetical protein
VIFLQNYIDTTKGLVLCKLVQSPKSIGFFQLKRNSGFSNLQKFPWRLQRLGTYETEEWRNLDDFKKWLQNNFSHLNSGVYYLLGYQGTLRYKKVGFKKYKKVRPYTGVAKFSVDGGSVSIPNDFKKSRRTHKTYRIFLMLADQPTQREGMMQEMKNQRSHGRIKIRR